WPARRARPGPAGRRAGRTAARWSDADWRRAAARGSWAASRDSFAPEERGEDRLSLGGAVRAHLISCEPHLAAPAPLAGGLLELARPFAARRNHVDAIDRAGRHAQLAADAPVLDHGVHLALCADDRIDRAGLDAARAADAAFLHHQRDRLALHRPVLCASFACTTFPAATWIPVRR